MFEINLKRVVGNVLDTPNAVNVAVQHIPKLENRHYPITVLDVPDVHLCLFRDDSHLRFSSRTTRIGIAKMLGMPSTMFQEDTVHTIHIGSTSVIYDVAAD